MAGSVAIVSCVGRATQQAQGPSSGQQRLGALPGCREQGSGSPSAAPRVPANGAAREQARQSAAPIGIRAAADRPPRRPTVGLSPVSLSGPRGTGACPRLPRSIRPLPGPDGRPEARPPNHTAQGRRRAVVLVPCGRRLRRCAAAGARRGGRGAFQWLPSRDSRPGAPLPGAPIPDRWRSASCRVACRDEARAWLPMRIRAFARSSAWDQPDTISSVEASDGVRFHWQAAGPRSGLELRSTRSTAKKTMVLAERTAYLRKGVGEWVTMGA